MSAFRITQRSIAQRTSGNMQFALQRLSTTQEKLSSGRMLSRPSDNPVATVSALRFRGEIRQSEQHVRNAEDGLGWLGSADRTLTTALHQIRRARDLTLQGANGAMGAEQRRAMGVEVLAIRDSLLGLANTRHAGRPLFAGTTDEARAYSTTTPSGVYTAAQGAGDAVIRTVAPGESIQVNMSGPEVFGADGSNIFDLLQSIATDLLNDDSTNLNTTHLTDIDARMRAVTDALGTIGARYNRVETMKDRGSDKIVTLKGSLSEVEDIDLPATIMDLQLQETAYKAALSAAARVLQPSLVDFLR